MRWEGLKCSSPISWMRALAISLVYKKGLYSPSQHTYMKVNEEEGVPHLLSEGCTIQVTLWDF